MMEDMCDNMIIDQDGQRVCDNITDISRFIKHHIVHVLRPFSTRSVLVDSDILNGRNAFMG